MQNRILDRMEQPSDLKALNAEQVLQLCEEIRAELIHTVSENGGHLASNLGVVELTVTLLRCFNLPNDSVFFDVGHQSYVYKLLTGRKDRFHTLRKRGGLSGFPRPYESDYDMFTAGHSSTALSSAIGLARAKQLNDDDSKVVVVVGDGAFGGGMVYEAMNTIDETLTNLVVILNDNSMSISKSVGGMSQYLLRIRTDVGYTNTKKRVRSTLERMPLVGDALSSAIQKSKAVFRRSLYDGRLFENFGFNYVGPIDGHDIFELNRLFRNVRGMYGPFLIHVNTIKGKGFAPAEKNPGAYHGVGKFNTFEGNEDISIADSFSNVFGKKLAEMASDNPDICTITAAMKYATGLNFFKQKYPERFFDVGIAEEHAVTFAAGLAKGGKTPVFAVYSTFLQRGYDQLFQDVALDRMNVVLAIDRAGLVGEDGETHHGLFDVSFLTSFGEFFIVSPSNYSELEDWIERMCRMNGPRAIRYPRGHSDARIADYISTGKDFDLISSDKMADTLFVTYGRTFAEIIEAKDSLNNENITVDILKLNVIWPISKKAVMVAGEYKNIIFVEEGTARGGINEIFLKRLYESGWNGRYRVNAIDGFVRHGAVDELLRECALDAASLTDTVRKILS